MSGMLPRTAISATPMALPARLAPTQSCRSWVGRRSHPALDHSRPRESGGSRPCSRRLRQRRDCSIPNAVRVVILPGRQKTRTFASYHFGVRGIPDGRHPGAMSARSSSRAGSPTPYGVPLGSCATRCSPARVCPYCFPLAPCDPGLSRTPTSSREQLPLASALTLEVLRARGAARPRPGTLPRHSAKAAACTAQEISRGTPPS
jgi:hypothetical protein